MDKKFIIYLLIFVLFSYNAIAEGICTLSKTYPDNYFPGEIATLECSCSENNEKNTDGYIVWKLSNGTILRSIATDSGDCKKSFFGDTYQFSFTANFTGNATFSENADGTGIPNDWDDNDDIVTRFFNVSGASIKDCIITNIKVPQKVNLGWDNSNVFQVIDGTTNNPIVGINCVAMAFSADGSPILLEPYSKEYDKYRTVAGGYGYLNNRFNQERFEVETTYEFDLYCQCTNNSENDAVCYDDSTGERLGYRSCQVTGLFTTNKDYREGKFNKSYLILAAIVFTIFMFLFSYSLKEKHPFLSLIMLLLSLNLIPIIGNMFLNITQNTIYNVAGEAFFKLCMRSIQIIAIYVIIYASYKVFMYFGVDLWKGFLNKVGFKRK